MAVRLYVAGPVTGVEDLNRPAFEEARELLALKGYAPLLPHDIVRDPATPWREALRQTLRAMLGCHGVALMDGWQASKGACLERNVALALAIPVRDVGAWAAWSDEKRRERERDVDQQR